MKFKVMTSHFGHLAQKEIITKNLSHYCELHGYELVLNFSDDIRIGNKIVEFYWIKIDEIIKNLSNCDYLLWLDSDTFIFDYNKKLESFIAPDFDFDLLMTCENCIQTGAYLFKVTDWSRQLLDRMIDFGKHYKQYNEYCDDTMALIRMLDIERYMGHGLDKIVSSHQDDVEFLQIIESERKQGTSGELLSHIKLVSNYDFMVKHVHIYQCPVKPFIIHIPGSTNEDKYRFLKYYSENQDLDWRKFKI